VVVKDREVLKAALDLRTGEWRRILRSEHMSQARLVLPHLVELPIRIHNKPKPRWIVDARPNGLAVGMAVQNVASPTGFAKGCTVLRFHGTAV